MLFFISPASRHLCADDSQVFTNSIPNLHSEALIEILSCQVDISNPACPKLNIRVFHLTPKPDLSVLGNRVPIHSAS